MGIGEAAAVAGALAHRGDLDLLETRLELVQRERERRGRAFAADIELPGGGVDAGDGRKMVADEEGVVGRDRVGEIGLRRFVIGRARREPDERPLAGKRFERGGVVEAFRQAGGQGRFRGVRKTADAQATQARARRPARATHTCDPMPAPSLCLKIQTILVN